MEIRTCELCGAWNVQTNLICWRCHNNPEAAKSFTEQVDTLAKKMGWIDSAPKDKGESHE